MIPFVIRRLVQGLLVVLVVSSIVFVLTRLVSDPVALMLPLSASDAQRAAFAEAMSHDRPLAAQYLRFLGDVASLDFGDSPWQRRPAIEVVFERLPNTLLLIAAGLGLAVLLSIPLGAIAALRPGGLVDRLTVSAGLLGLAMPQFWLCLLYTSDAADE